MRKFFLLLMAVVFLVGGFHHAAAQESGTPMKSPKETIREFLDSVMEINEEDIPTLEKEKKLGGLTGSFFHPAKITIFIVGKSIYNSLDPRKKEFLLTRLEDHVICVATGVCESKINLKTIRRKYGFQIISERIIGGDAAEVEIIFNNDMAKDLKVSFMLEMVDDTWLIYDIKSIGLRLTGSYQEFFQRDSFSSVDKFTAKLQSEIESSKNRLVQDEKL